MGESVVKRSSTPRGSCDLPVPNQNHEAFVIVHVSKCTGRHYFYLVFVKRPLDTELLVFEKGKTCAGDRYFS